MNGQGHSASAKHYSGGVRLSLSGSFFSLLLFVDLQPGRGALGGPSLMRGVQFKYGTFHF